jgi:GxxExxY protein
VLGPGYVHRVYANACYYDVALRGLAVRRIKRMLVDYKDKLVGEIAFGHLLIEGRVMVFPTAAEETPLYYIDNFKSRMRRNGVQLGILANFNSTRLQPLFIRACKSPTTLPEGTDFTRRSINY